MTVLNNDDYQDLKKRIKNDPDARSEFKSWGLYKQTWKDLFQAAEDWFVNGFLSTPTTSAKVSLEAATEVMTNAQAKQVYYVWGGWRYAKNP